MVDVGALVDQLLDEVQVIHVRLAQGVIAAFDIAVVDRNIQRRPGALVDDVGVGAMVEQKGPELVVPILRRDEQRAPAVVRHLVHVGAGREQDARRFQIVDAGRERQRREAAAPLIP